MHLEFRETMRGWSCWQKTTENWCWIRTEGIIKVLNVRHHYILSACTQATYCEWKWPSKAQNQSQSKGTKC